MHPVYPYHHLLTSTNLQKEGLLGLTEAPKTLWIMALDRRKNLPQGISVHTIDHFSAIALAQSTLQDPNFVPFPSSRTVTHSGRGHTLTGRTWNSPDTIKELLSFRRVSLKPELPFPQPEDVRAEARRFYTFGSDLNAHPDLLHGGVIATIMDSSLGQAVECAFPDSGDGARGSMFTVQLNVSYKKPVRTPGTVVVRAWVKGIEGEAGRKVWVEGVIEGEAGVVHARGEGLWVRGGGKGKL